MKCICATLHLCRVLKYRDAPEEIKHVENLEWVDLSFLPKMVCIPQALRLLSSLRSLSLYWLSELQSIPDWLHQLRSLSVSSYPKVVSIPALRVNCEWLPTTGETMPERKWRGLGQDFPHPPASELVTNFAATSSFCFPSYNIFKSLCSSFGEFMFYVYIDN